MSYKQAFVTTIQRMFAHEVIQARANSDTDIKHLIPHHAQIMRIVTFGVACSETRIATAECVERYFNLIERGRFEEQWLPIVETLCESAEIQSNPTLWHTLCHCQIILLRLARNFDTAIAHIKALQTQPLPALLVGKLLLEHSECLRSQDQFAPATMYALEALNVFVESGDKKWQASARNNLVILMTEQEQFEDAKEYAHQAVVFERNHNDATRMVRILTNQGYLYQRMKTWELAKRVYFEAQEYLSEIDNVADSVTVLYNLGYVYTKIGLLDDAQNALYEARQQLQTGN